MNENQLLDVGRSALRFAKKCLLPFAAIAVVPLALSMGGCSSGDEAPAVDPREEAIEEYLVAQEELGWSRDEIEIEDNGEGEIAYVTFSSEDIVSQELAGYDEEGSQQEADELSKALSSPVIMRGYTDDEHLVMLCIGGLGDFGDDEQVTNAALDIITEYIEAARPLADAWLNEYVENAKGYFDGLNDVRFKSEGDGLYGIAFLWDEGCPDQNDSEAAAEWQYEADYLSRILASDVVLMHGTAAEGQKSRWGASYRDNMIVSLQNSGAPEGAQDSE